MHFFEWQVLSSAKVRLKSSDTGLATVLWQNNRIIRSRLSPALLFKGCDPYPPWLKLAERHSLQTDECAGLVDGFYFIKCLISAFKLARFVTTASFYVFHVSNLYIFHRAYPFHKGEKTDLFRHTQPSAEHSKPIQSFCTLRCLEHDHAHPTAHPHCFGELWSFSSFFWVCFSIQ